MICGQFLLAGEAGLANGSAASSTVNASGQAMPAATAGPRFFRSAACLRCLVAAVACEFLTTQQAWFAEECRLQFGHTYLVFICGEMMRKAWADLHRQAHCRHGDKHAYHCDGTLLASRMEHSRSGTEGSQEGEKSRGTRAKNAHVDDTSRKRRKVKKWIAKLEDALSEDSPNAYAPRTMDPPNFVNVLQVLTLYRMGTVRGRA